MDCNSVPVPVLISSSGSPPSGEHDIIRPTPRRPKEGPSPSAGMTSSQEEDVVVKPTNFGSSVEKVGKVLQRKLSNTSSVHSGHSLTKKTVPVKQKSSPVELVPERDSNPSLVTNVLVEGGDAGYQILSNEEAERDCQGLPAMPGRGKGVERQVPVDSGGHPKGPRHHVSSQVVGGRSKPKRRLHKIAGHSKGAKAAYGTAGDNLTKDLENANRY